MNQTGQQFRFGESEFEKTSDRFCIENPFTDSSGAHQNKPALTSRFTSNLIRDSIRVCIGFTW